MQWMDGNPIEEWFSSMALLSALTFQGAVSIDGLSDERRIAIARDLGWTRRELDDRLLLLVRLGWIEIIMSGSGWPAEWELAFELTDGGENLAAQFELEALPGGDLPEMLANRERQRQRRRTLATAEKIARGLRRWGWRLKRS
jgi:hypothetical protein